MISVENLKKKFISMSLDQLIKEEKAAQRESSQAKNQRKPGMSGMKNLRNERRRISVYIGGINPATIEKDLWDLLSQTANISEIDYTPGEPNSTGHAFAYLSNKIDAKKLVEDCNGILFQGSRLSMKTSSVY